MYCVYYIYKESDRDRWKERKHAQFFFTEKDRQSERFGGH